VVGTIEHREQLSSCPDGMWPFTSAPSVASPRPGVRQIRRLSSCLPPVHSRFTGPGTARTGWPKKGRRRSRTGCRIGDSASRFGRPDRPAGGAPDGETARTHNSAGLARCSRAPTRSSNTRAICCGAKVRSWHSRPLARSCANGCMLSTV